MKFDKYADIDRWAPLSPNTVFAPSLAFLASWRLTHSHDSSFTRAAARPAPLLVSWS